MSRFALLPLVIAISAPLFAQSIFARKHTIDLVTVTKYCAKVDNYSNSQVPRIFARITSAYGPSTGWVRFDSRSAWRRAGSPKPAALVWYRDATIVRVAMSANYEENPPVYADYCYRQDGTLARLRSVPSERQRCEPSRDQCTYVLSEVRFYPPDGPVLKEYGAAGDEFLDLLNGTTRVIMEAPPAERAIQIFVPMKWPEYRRVTELPFNELLYASD